MPKDVFISHSSADVSVAKEVCQALETKGISCWIAHRDIMPGKNYGEAIVRAISGSRILILILSSAATKSPHVLREVERAGSKGIEILPFRIEDVPISEAMEYFISSSHWLNAFTSPLSSHLDDLASAVANSLSMHRQTEPAPRPATDRDNRCDQSATTEQGEEIRATREGAAATEAVEQDAKDRRDSAEEQPAKQVLSSERPLKAILSSAPCTQANLADLVLTADDLARDLTHMYLQFIREGRSVGEIWLNISRDASEPIRYFRLRQLELDLDAAVRGLPLLLRVYRSDYPPIHNWLTAKSPDRIYKIFSKDKVILKESVGYINDNGSFTEVIPADTVLPHIRDQQIHTSADNQRSLRVRVAVRSVDRVRELGEITIKGIVRARAGIPFIECKFRVDEDGRLVVTARDPVSKGNGLVIIG